MRLLLGQLYDQRTALCLEQLYVAEVLIPQEQLHMRHLRTAVHFVMNKHPALRACFRRSEGEWRMGILGVDAFPVDQAFSVFARVPGVESGAQVQAGIDAVSPFQVQGEISPGKNAILHHTTAGFTLPDL
ncbi:hypothetical protein D3C80_1432410 [compost metagenome]